MLDDFSSGGRVFHLRSLQGENVPFNCVTERESVNFSRFELIPLNVVIDRKGRTNEDGRSQMFIQEQLDTVTAQEEGSDVRN